MPLLSSMWGFFFASLTIVVYYLYLAHLYKYNYSYSNGFNIIYWVVFSIWSSCFTFSPAFFHSFRLINYFLFHNSYLLTCYLYMFTVLLEVYFSTIAYIHFCLFSSHQKLCWSTWPSARIKPRFSASCLYSILANLLGEKWMYLLTYLFGLFLSLEF